RARRMAQAARTAAERAHDGVTGGKSSGGFWQSLKFNPSYWYVVGVCLTFYSAIFPFRTFAIDFFTNRILNSSG
ncbi:hypothetical protein AAER08_14385, partial [Pseudomonas aeruginosa]